MSAFGMARGLHLHISGQSMGICLSDAIERAPLTSHFTGPPRFRTRTCVLVAFSASLIFHNKNQPHVQSKTVTVHHHHLVWQPRRSRHHSYILCSEVKIGQNSHTPLHQHEQKHFHWSTQPWAQISKGTSLSKSYTYPCAFLIAPEVWMTSPCPIDRIIFARWLDLSHLEMWAVLVASFWGMAKTSETGYVLFPAILHCLPIFACSSFDQKRDRCILTTLVGFFSEL